MATSPSVFCPAESCAASTGSTSVMGFMNIALDGPIFHIVPTAGIPEGAASVVSASMVKTTDWPGAIAPAGTKITTP
jgi:hypothetical protein